MANRIPLKIEGGKLKQFGAGDTISPTIAPGAAGSNPVYARGTFTIASGEFIIMSRRLILTGSQRFTGLGTGALRIT